MRLITRVGSAIAAAASIFGLLALAGPGTASAQAYDHHHGPSLIGGVTVIAPVDVHIVDNTIAILGVIDD